MPRETLFTTGTKITLVFMLLGLTAWYLVQPHTENSALEFAALIGVGVVVPTLINEFRGRDRAH
jgi:hypothetical protein